MTDIAFGDFLQPKVYGMATSASGGSVQRNPSKFLGNSEASASDYVSLHNEL